MSVGQTDTLAGGLLLPCFDLTRSVLITRLIVWTVKSEFLKKLLFDRLQVPHPRNVSATIIKSSFGKSHCPSSRDFWVDFALGEHHSRQDMVGLLWPPALWSSHLPEVLKLMVPPSVVQQATK